MPIPHPQYTSRTNFNILPLQDSQSICFVGRCRGQPSRSLKKFKVTRNGIKQQVQETRRRLEKSMRSKSPGSSRRIGSRRRSGFVMDYADEEGEAVQNLQS
jgi:hypothetical protein